MARVRAAITGIHGYVPDQVLSNDDLSKLVDTSDRWITERTGIKERRILKEGLGTSYMAAEAVKGLLAKTGTKPEEIDVLVCATVTPDYIFPGTANLVSSMLSMRNIGSFDVMAACSGFIYGLSTGIQFVETGRARKAIVVGADTMSTITNYTDRGTCILFGDGAGAVLIEARDDGTGVHDIVLHSDATLGLPNIVMKGGGSRHPASRETVDGREHSVWLNGPVVFRHAVEKMTEVSAELLERNNLQLSDIDWLVPHQANLRIMESVATRFGLPRERLLVTVQKYGNTTAATIPLTLWDYEKQIKTGDRVLIVAFGGGYTWGAAYIVWSFDGS